MAKPNTTTDPNSKNQKSLLPLVSPIKNRRTTKTKPRNMIQPETLRKMVGNISHFLASSMDNLTPPTQLPPTKIPPTSNTSPKQTPQTESCPAPAQNPTPTINPTPPLSQTTSRSCKTTKAHSTMAQADFYLRRSPRKHSTPTITAKTSAYKTVRPPPTDYTSTDVDMMESGRNNKTNSVWLVDEDNTSDGTEAVQGKNVGMVEGVDGNNGTDDQHLSSDEGDEDENGDEVAEGVEGDDGVDSGEDSEHDEGVEGDEDEEEFLGKSVPKKRRVRGPTRCLRLVGVKGKARPKVMLNQFNQPIGPEPDIQSLAQLIGILAKTPKVVSLEYPSWKKVPDKANDAVWDMINITFKIPLDGKPWVVKTASDSWRTFKSHLKKKYFREDLKEAQMLSRRPKLKVPEKQWKALVKYWFDPKTIEMSRRNRISVHHRKNVHTASSRSFARIAASEAKDGKDPSLAAVCLKTQTNKGGVARVDEKTREELLKLAQDDSQVEEYLVANNLLKKRPGSVLLKGRGVTKTAVRRAKYEKEANKTRLIFFG